jgi:tetratricopeptide (TPR) repeat protein
MREDNSYIREVIENLNKQIYSIDQEVQKLTNLNIEKLKECVNSFKRELVLVSKENDKVVSESESQNSVTETLEQVTPEMSTQTESATISETQTVLKKPVQLPVKDQNYILKDIRSKLKNLDDIIKKAKEDKAKPQDHISQEVPNNEIKNQDSVLPQNVSINEIRQENQQLPCDSRTKEVFLSNEEKSDINGNTVVKKEESNGVTIGKFDELIKAEPTNFKHYMERAGLYIKRNDYYKAESDYKKAQGLTQSKDVSVLLALANLYNLSGNSKKVLALYNQTFELNPSNVDVLQQRAAYYLSSGKDDEFLEDIEKAISLDKNNAKNYAIRAEYNASKEFYHKALNDVNIVIKLRPDNISAKYFRGVMLYNLEKYNECFDDMKQTLESNSSENEVYKYIGICSFKLNKFEESMVYLAKAVDVGVRDEMVFYYKAQVEYEIGNFDASLRDVSKVIDINSKEYKYYLLRARVCNKKEFFDQSYKDYEKAYKLESTLNVLIEKADFLIKYGKYKQALKDYTLAINLDSTKKNFYKKRSYIYEKLGKFEKAKDDLQKALSINPSSLIDRAVSLTEPQVQQSVESINSEPEHEPKPLSEAREHAQQTLPEETSNLVSKYEQLPQEQNIVDLQTLDESETKQEVSEQKVVQEDNIKKEQAVVETSQQVTSEVPTQTELMSVLDVSEKSSVPTEVVSIPISGISADILFNRANINYKNKKFDIALKDIEDIISQDQGYVKAYTLKAEIYHQLQDIEKELQVLNKSIELTPSLFLPYVKRAEIYVSQNKEDLAFSDFSKALELNPKNGSVYIGLARIYAKRDQKDKALENYNNAKKYELKSIKMIDQEIQALS